MGDRSKKFFRKFARNWPGFQRYGFYSLFPIFFFSGFGLELFMIKFKFYGKSFYKTFNNRRLAEINDEIDEQMLVLEQLTKKLKEINDH